MDEIYLGNWSPAKNPGETPSLEEVRNNAYSAAQTYQNANSWQRQEEEEIDRLNDSIQKAGGKPLSNPWRVAPSADDYAAIRDQTIRDGRPVMVNKWLHDKYERDLLALRDQHPDLISPETVPSFVVSKRMKDAEAKTADISTRRGWTDPKQLPVVGSVPLVREFTGAAVDTIRDPAGMANQFAGGLAGIWNSPADIVANLLPFGAGSASKSIIKNAVINAIGNAGGQAALEPSVQANRAKGGLEYGIGPALEDIAGAAATGAVLDVGVRAPVRAFNRAVDPKMRIGEARNPDTQFGGVLTDAPAKSTLPEPPRPAPTIDPETFKAAEAGDVPALRKLAEQTRAIEDPSVKAMVEHLELTGSVDEAVKRFRDEMQSRTGTAIDDGDLQRTVAGHLRAAIDPDVLPPRREPAAVRPAAEPLMDAEAAKILTDHAPQVSQIVQGLEPRIAAMVSDGLEAGLAPIVRAVQQAIDAGPEGQPQTIANLGNAISKAADAMGGMETFADHITLHSGRSSIMEVATAMRRSPEVVDSNVSFGTEMMQVARAIAMLDDGAFNILARGEADPRIGQMVADTVEPGRQAGVLDQVARAGVRDLDEARRLIADLEPRRIPEPVRDGVDDPNSAETKAATERMEQSMAPEVEMARKAVPEPQPGQSMVDAIMQSAVVRRGAETREAIVDAIRLASKILPEGTRLEIENAEMRDPRTGGLLDAQTASNGDIILAAYAMNPAGRIGHEGVHTLVARGLLSPDEVKLLAEAAGKTEIKAEGAKEGDAPQTVFPAERRAQYAEAYADRPNLDQLLDEEAAAHLIEAVVNKKAIPEDAPKSVIERIQKMLDAIAERLKNWRDGKGWQTAEDLINDIINGEVAKREGVKAWMRGEDISALAVKPPEPERAAPVTEPEIADPVSKMPMTGDEVEAIVDMWRYVDEMRRAPKPERLSQFVRRMGGINDEQTELRHIMGGAKGLPGLVSKNGLDLDAATRAAWDAGYLQGTERPEINALLDALNEDLHGNEVFRDADAARADDIRIANEMAGELDQLGVAGFKDESAVRSYFGATEGRARPSDRQVSAGSAEPLPDVMFALRSGEFDLDPVDITSTDSYRGRRFFYRITENGQQTGLVAEGYVNGSRASIDWIGKERKAGEVDDYGYPLGQMEPNRLGPVALHRLREAMRRDFPDVNEFSGWRMSGARRGPAARAGADPVQSVKMYALSDRETGQSMRRDLDSLGYYSQALEAARSLKQAKGTPEQMLAQLKSAGVKDAEIEATGLRSFLNGKKAVTRDDIVGHLEGNRVGLSEVQRAPQLSPEQRRLRDEARSRLAQMDSVQAEAYRRVLEEQRRLHGANSNLYDFSGLRDVQQQISAEYARMSQQRVDNIHPPVKWSAHSLNPSNPTYRETVLHLPVSSSKMPFDEYLRRYRQTVPNGRATDADVRGFYDSGEPLNGDNSALFNSGHFPEPNIVGHMMTSMTKHQGKPVFTLDQIQSDWGQKLRDGGVRDEAKIAELRKQIADLQPAEDAAFMEAKQRGATSGERDELLRKFASDKQRIEAELRTAEASSSGHPLVNTTDQWVNTTLRRALRQAAEAGADYIAIPHGDTVLSYNPGDEGGMRGFYGSRSSEGIVPKNLRKLLEKLDKDSARPVKVDNLETPSGTRGYRPNAQDKFDKAETGFTLFPLTDKVKAEVTQRGQAMFAFAGEPPEAIARAAAERFGLPDGRPHDVLVALGDLIDRDRGLVKNVRASVKAERDEARQFIDLISKAMSAPKEDQGIVDGYTAKIAERYSGDDGTERSYVNLYRDGKMIADATVIVDQAAPNTMVIEWIETLDGTRLSVSDIRAMRESIRAEFPNVKKFSGFRVSGAKEEQFAETDPRRNQTVVMFAFAGEKARTADLDALSRAQQMEADGVDRDTIWLKEGWGRFPDGRWKFELDDSNAAVYPSSLELDGKTEHAKPFRDVMTHAPLLAAYPDFAKLNIQRVSGNQFPGRKGRGAFYASHGGMVIDAASADRGLSIALHEIQHGVQNTEGFAKGTNPIGAALAMTDDEYANASRIINAQKQADYDKALAVHGKQVAAAEASDAARQERTDTLKRLREERNAVAADPASKDKKGILKPEAKARLDALDQEYDAIWKTKIEIVYHPGEPPHPPEMGKPDPYDLYRMHAGEVESRTVQKRMNMTAEERRARAPWHDFDVPEDQQIVRFANGEARQAEPQSPFPSDLQTADRLKDAGEAIKGKPDNGAMYALADPKSVIDALERKSTLGKSEADEIRKKLDHLKAAGMSDDAALDAVAAELEGISEDKKRVALLGEKARQTLIGDLVKYRNHRGETDVLEAWKRLHERFDTTGAYIEDLETARLSIQERTLERMGGLLKEFKRGALTGDMRRKTGRTYAKQQNMVRELFGESTRDQTANELATAVGAMFEDLRLRFNKAGGHIGKLEKWGMPQGHDAQALRDYGMQKWVDYMLQDGVLDRDRMVSQHTGRKLTDGELRDALTMTWQRITTDGWVDREISGQPMGRGALFNQHADHRFLHFKSADAWLRYAKDFGNPDPYAAIMNHVARMSRDIAHMERLGPNPQMMRTYIRNWMTQKAASAGSVESLIREQQGKMAQIAKDHAEELKDLLKGRQELLDELAERYLDMERVKMRSAIKRGLGMKEEQAKRLADLDARTRVIDNLLYNRTQQRDLLTMRHAMVREQIADMMRAMREAVEISSDKDPQAALNNTLNRVDAMWELQRGALVPVSTKMANVLAIGRNIISADALGSAVISSITDPAYGQEARKRWGESFARSNAGTVMGQTLKQMFKPGARWEALDSGIAMDSAMSVFHSQAKQNKSWLPWMRDMSGYINDRVLSLGLLTPWTEAGKAAHGTWLQLYLGRNAHLPFDKLAPDIQKGLTANGFDASSWEQIRMSRLYDPKTHGPATRDSQAKQLRPKEIEAAAGQDLAERYIAMIVRETRHGVIETTVESRAMVIGTTRPGSIPGEIVRSAGQFKGFPLAVVFIVLGRLAREIGAGDYKSAARHAASLAITSAFLGFAAMALKDIKDGRDPRRLLDEKTWMAFDTWAAAILQAGGLGIWGDFLFSNVNRQGNGLAATLGGPMVDRIDNIKNLTIGNLFQIYQGKDTQVGREGVRFLRQNVPGVSSWFFTSMAWNRIFMDEMQRMVDPKAHEQFRAQIMNRRRDYGGQEYWWKPGQTRPERAPDLTRPFATQ